MFLAERQRLDFIPDAQFYSAGKRSQFRAAHDRAQEARGRVGRRIGQAKFDRSRKCDDAMQQFMLRCTIGRAKRSPPRAIRTGLRSSSRMDREMTASTHNDAKLKSFEVFAPLADALEAMLKSGSSGRRPRFREAHHRLRQDVHDGRPRRRGEGDRDDRERSCVFDPRGREDRPRFSDRRLPGRRGVARRTSATSRRPRPRPTRSGFNPITSAAGATSPRNASRRSSTISAERRRKGKGPPNKGPDSEVQREPD